MNNLETLLKSNDKNNLANCIYLLNQKHKGNIEKIFKEIERSKLYQSLSIDEQMEINSNLDRDLNSYLDKANITLDDENINFRKYDLTKHTHLGENGFNYFSNGLKDRLTTIKNTKNIYCVLDTFNKLGGFTAGSVVYLGASPSMCKTMLSLSFALDFIQRGYEVIYLSLETSTNALTKRLIKTYLEWDKKYNDGSRVYKDFKSMSDEEIEELSAFIGSKDFFTRLSIKEDIRTDNDIKKLLEEKIPNLYGNDKKPIVILDYLHCVRSESNEDASEMIKKVGGYFKDYAKKYDTLAFIISANNRNQNMKPARSSMYSGRDTSDIEYNANYIMQINYYEWERGNLAIGENDLKMNYAKDHINHLTLTIHKDKEGETAGNIIKFDAHLENGFIEDLGLLDKKEMVNIQPKE